MAKRAKAEDHELPKAGHNGPSHDDIRLAANELVQWNVKRDKLNKEIGAFRKGLKAKGITLGVLDAMVKMLEWSPEEVKEHFAERNWYAEALRYPVGSQLEMFGGEETPDHVKEDLRWRNIGYKDGVSGRGWPNEFPDGCPPEHFQGYSNGWEEGQKVVQDGFMRRASMASTRASIERDGIVESETAEPEADDETYAEARG